VRRPCRTAVNKATSHLQMVSENSSEGSPAEMPFDACELTGDSKR